MKPSFKHFHYMLASSTTYCYLHNTIFSSFSWEQWNRTTVSGITCELTTTLIPLLVLATRCTLNSIMSNHSSSLRYELTYYCTLTLKQFRQLLYFSILSWIVLQNLEYKNRQLKIFTEFHSFLRIDVLRSLFSPWDPLSPYQSRIRNYVSFSFPDSFRNTES